MRRREFLALAGAAAAALPLPTLVRAQQTTTKHMGMLTNLTADDPRGKTVVDALWTGIEKQGWTKQALLADYRWGADSADAAQQPAKELVALRPDVLFATTTPAVSAFAELTQTIPIVFAYFNGATLADLRGTQDYAHPLGNMTGLVNAPDNEIRAKTVDLLKAMVPNARGVAVIYNPDAVPGGDTSFLSSYSGLLANSPLEFVPIAVRTPQEISDAIDRVAADGSLGLIMSGDGYLTANRDVALTQVAKHRLVAIYQSSQAWTDSGGLIGYAIDTVTTYSGAGEYIGLILSGAKPSDLPIQIPALWLTVNVKTAKTLGITIPLSILASADQLIE